MNCTDLFDVRKTDDGFCCSFNTLDQSQNIDISSIPVPSNSITNGISGMVAGLFGLFDVDYNDDDVLTTSPPATPSVQASLFQEESTVTSVLDGSLKKGLDILERVKRQITNATEENLETEIEIADEVKTEESLSKLRRTNSASYLLGLTVLLDAKSDNYYVAPENYVGFKALLTL